MKNKIVVDNSELFEKFKYSIGSRVKFDEVDSFGVVHNIKYLYWLEWARLEYFRHIGIKIHKHTVIRDFPVMVVRNEIDYLNMSEYDDEYIVYTRVAKVKNSSLIFENIIALKDGTVLVKAVSVLVHLNKDKRPNRLPDNVRDMIKSHEGDNVEFID